jgi:hypothetical protein
MPSWQGTRFSVDPQTQLIMLPAGLEIDLYTHEDTVKYGECLGLRVCFPRGP